MRPAYMRARAQMIAGRAIVGLCAVLAVCWWQSAGAQVSVATFNGLKAYTATVATRMLDLERRVMALEQSAPGGSAAGLPAEFVGRVVNVENEQTRQAGLWAEHQDYIRRLRTYLATADYALQTLLCRHRYDDPAQLTMQGAVITTEHPACTGTGLSPAVDPLP